jgi:hypothetical protein
MLSVSSVAITSVTSVADTDGNGANAHVTIPSGTATTVTANFTYSTGATGTTTAEFEILGLALSTGEQAVATGSGQSASLALAVPGTAAAGTYNAKVTVRNSAGSGANSQVDVESSAVEINLTVTILASSTINNGVPSDAIYNGTPQGISGVTVTDVNGTVSGAVTTTTYYNTQGTPDTGDDVSLPGAPVDAGEYRVVSTYAGDATHSPSSDTDVFSIAKAGSVTTNNDVPAAAVYNGLPQGISGASVTGAGVVTGAAATVYYDTKGTADTGDDVLLAGAPINAGEYRVVSTYAGDQNHTGSSDTDVFTIAQAMSVTTNNDVPSGVVYDGLSHGISGASVTGAGVVTGSVVTVYYDTNGTADTGDDVELAAAPVNAGTYRVVSTYAGDQNHTGSSDEDTFTISARSLDQYATATTQSALNIAKDGTISFAISVSGGVVDGQTVAQLFDGAAFTLQMANGSGGYESVTVTASATVIDGVVYVNLRMNQEVYTFLKQGYDAGEINASKAGWESITLSAASNDQNYTLATDALTRIFQSGKVSFV